MSGRTLHRLASNQLISLLDWAAVRELGPSAASAGLQARAASSSALTKSLKYARDRKSYESGMSELRKAWAKEHEEAEARRAAAARAAEARRKAALSRRAQTDAADKETRRQELVARQQAEREQRAAIKQERLRRQELRMDILDAARAAQREALLRDSRHWIGADALEARVQEALDNPVPLWGAAARGPN